MAQYDDYRIAGEEEAERMNAEFSEINSAKGRKKALEGLPVYLTDEARRTAGVCRRAAEGCEYLLDYATTSEEKSLLGYAAAAMNGLCNALGGDKKPIGEDRFGASGVKRALSKTFLLCNQAAIKLCALYDSSGGEAHLAGAAETALCCAQSVMAVYVMQI